MKYSIEAKKADPVMDFVMLLLHARTNAHILHWTTSSYSAHQALNFFYEGVPSLLDGFVEGFQGRYGKLHDFQSGFEPASNALSYLTEVCAKIEQIRRQTGFPQDSFLQNKVDEIVDLCSSTIYKLRELK